MNKKWNKMTKYTKNRTGKWVTNDLSFCKMGPLVQNHVNVY